MLDCVPCIVHSPNEWVVCVWVWVEEGECGWGLMDRWLGFALYVYVMF